jgi:DNA repair protein RadC
VSYRRGRPKDGKQERMPFFVASSQNCAEYLRRLWDDDTIELREEFVLLCLSGSHEVLGWVKLHTGGFSHAAVDLRLVLGVALQTASSSVVVAHNHPSGSLTPSPEDRALTRRLADACELVGVRFLDHVIVTRDASYSFADNGKW